MYNFRPKLADVDPDNPNMWGRCDKCGFITNIDKMVWQYAYQGSSMPQNTRILTCGRQTCLDPLNPQDTPIILSPDPEPVFNARPYPYVLEESSWLLTQDGDIITTEDDEDFVTPLPNPTQDAATSYLQATLDVPGGSVAVMYMDIFDGNPLSIGVSVLADITGSATRTNVASQLTTTASIARNTDAITLATASGATVNSNYIAFYGAATGGSPLMSGALSVAGQTITEGNPVVFAGLDLSIDLNS